MCLAVARNIENTAKHHVVLEVGRFALHQWRAHYPRGLVVCLEGEFTSQPYYVRVFNAETHQESSLERIRADPSSIDVLGSAYSLSAFLDGELDIR